MDNISLGEIFSEDGLAKLKPLIENKDLKGLDEYLKSQKEILLERGIDHKYLYYQICYLFKL